MKIIQGLAVLMLGVSGTVMADECRGLLHDTASHSDASGGQLAAMVAELTAIFSRHPPDSEECSSAATVLSKLMNSTVIGGKRLEKPRPLDVSEAQAQLTEAQDDAATRDRLNELKSETTDPNVQLLVEAVVLESQGLHSARDLKVQDLRQRLASAAQRPATKTAEAASHTGQQ